MGVKLSIDLLHRLGQLQRRCYGQAPGAFVSDGYAEGVEQNKIITIGIYLADEPLVLGDNILGPHKKPLQNGRCQFHVLVDGNFFQPGNVDKL